VFFDVRNDSDALYAHYDIRLRGVEDVQLMENASRDGPIWKKRYLNSLPRCIKNDTVLDADSHHWEEVQQKGKKLFPLSAEAPTRSSTPGPCQQTFRRIAPMEWLSYPGCGVGTGES
jgi:exonuclease 3'-5' domain-containing protein 1